MLLQRAGDSLKVTPVTAMNQQSQALPTFFPDWVSQIKDEARSRYLQGTITVLDREIRKLDLTHQYHEYKNY